MKTNLLRALLPILFTLSAALHADDWAQSGEKLHQQLQQRSNYYRYLTEQISARHRLRFRDSTEIALGTVVSDGKTLEIQLNPQLTGNHRATVMIWEIANAYQREIFDEIGRRARSGEISDAKEYGLRMELVEYSSFRHHKQVLDELQRSVGNINGDYLFFINPSLKNLNQYNLPYVHDYIDAQAKSGHTAHYERWFDKARQ